MGSELTFRSGLHDVLPTTFWLYRRWACFRCCQSDQQFISMDRAIDVVGGLRRFRAIYYHQHAVSW